MKIPVSQRELRMLLEPLLSREGFDVRLASDGEECVEEVAERLGIVDLVERHMRS